MDVDNKIWRNEFLKKDISALSNKKEWLRIFQLLGYQDAIPLIVT